MTLKGRPFENIEGKGKNAGNHFLLFPKCVLPFPKEISILQQHNISLSANAFNLDLSKMLTFGWLVVFGFNATLTAKVILWRSLTHMCFLAFSPQY